MKKYNNGLLYLKRLFWIILTFIGIIIFSFSPTFQSVNWANNLILKIFIWLNLTTFLIFGIDKYLSLTNSIRFPNKFLFILSGISSGLGSLMARMIFRHKIRNYETSSNMNYRTRFSIIEPLSFFAYVLLFIAFD